VYGPLTRATIGMNRDTGRSKGFGFVAFEQHDHAAAALAALQGHEVEGRAFRIDWDPGAEGMFSSAFFSYSSVSGRFQHDFMRFHMFSKFVRKFQFVT